MALFGFLTDALGAKLGPFAMAREAIDGAATWQADARALKAAASWLASRSDLTFDQVASLLATIPFPPAVLAQSRGGWATLALLFCIHDGAPLAPTLH